MKLLFDANLSPKLVNQLQDLFPAEDSVIWSYAKQNGLDIVTADGDDYPPLTSRFGPPPKIILLASWRFPTKVALELIRTNAILISEFEKTNQGLLVLRAQ